MEMGFQNWMSHDDFGELWQCDVAQVVHVCHLEEPHEFVTRARLRDASLDAFLDQQINSLLEFLKTHVVARDGVLLLL